MDKGCEYEAEGENVKKKEWLIVQSLAEVAAAQPFGFAMGQD
jgi:hypothetical protein